MQHPCRSRSRPMCPVLSCYLSFRRARASGTSSGCRGVPFRCEKTECSAPTGRSGYAATGASPLLAPGEAAFAFPPCSSRSFLCVADCPGSDLLKDVQGSRQGSAAQRHTVRSSPTSDERTSARVRPARSASLRPVIAANSRCRRYAATAVINGPRQCRQLLLRVRVTQPHLEPLYMRRMAYAPPVCCQNGCSKRCCQRGA